MRVLHKRPIRFKLNCSEPLLWPCWSFCPVMNICPAMDIGHQKITVDCCNSHTSTGHLLDPASLRSCNVGSVKLYSISFDVNV